MTHLQKTGTGFSVPVSGACVIGIKAFCSITHQKQQKKYLISSSFPTGHGCNRSHILHPQPNKRLEENQIIFALLGVLLNNGP